MTRRLDLKHCQETEIKIEAAGMNLDLNFHAISTAGRLSLYNFRYTVGKNHHVESREASRLYKTYSKTSY